MKYLPFLLAGVLLFLAGRSCGQPEDELAVAIDTMLIRIEQSEKDSLRWSGVVDSLGDEAATASASADSLRALARALGSRIGRRSPSTASPVSTSPALPNVGQDTSVLSPREDSLAQAYALMVKVDSLNQLQLAAKDSIIAADRQYIASLEAVRNAGRQVIKSRPSFLSKILPRPMVGYGVSLVGGELRTGPTLSLGWSF